MHEGTNEWWLTIELITIKKKTIWVDKLVVKRNEWRR